MDVITFNFSDDGNIENEKIIDIVGIGMSASVAERKKCEFYIETLTELDVVNNNTYFYLENSRELGGVITEQSKVGDIYKYKGKTFRGMLAERYLVPDDGYTHKIFNNSQDAIDYCIRLVFPNSLIIDNSTSKINEYKFRYTNCFTAIQTTCDNDLRLEFAIEVLDDYKSILKITIENIVNRTDILEADTKALDIDYTLSEKNSYNHVLALGGGEMLERQKYELWLHGDMWLELPHDKRLITYLYDYPSVEDLDSLKKETRNKSKSLMPANSYEFPLKDEALKNAFFVAKLGDKMSLDGIELTIAETEEIADEGDMYLDTIFQLGTKTKDIRTRLDGDEPLNKN